MIIAKKQNLVELVVGLNVVELSGGWLLPQLSFGPALILPANKTLSQLGVVVDQPVGFNAFLSNKFAPLYLRVGLQANQDYFLPRVNLGSVGQVANTGAFFSSPTTWSVDKNIYFTWEGSTRIWTTWPNLNYFRYFGGASGEANLGLVFGGGNGGSPGTMNSTEKWTGTAWAASGNLNTARSDTRGFGLQNDSVVCGGWASSALATCEKYNGTSWSSTGSLNQAREGHGSVGVSIAGLAFGGTTGFPSVLSSSEKFNGSTWSTSSNLSQGRGFMAGFGTQNSALCVGGTNNSVWYNSVEGFDGVAWLTEPNALIQRDSSGAGSFFDGLVAGGYNGSYLDSTELWNGSSWYMGNPLAIPRRGHGGFGNFGVASGQSGSQYTTSVEFAQTVGEDSLAKVGNFRLFALVT